MFCWGAGTLLSISDSIKFTKEKVYSPVDLFFDFFIVSSSTEPRCVCQPSKPRQLTLRVPTGVSLNHTDCIVPTTRVVEICENVTVADRSERLGIRGDTAGQ